MTIYCYYYVKNHPTKAKLAKILTGSRLGAAKEFAAQKQLPLKTFLSIWGVAKKTVL